MGLRCRTVMSTYVYRGSKEVLSSGHIHWFFHEVMSSLRNDKETENEDVCVTQIGDAMNCATFL